MKVFPVTLFQLHIKKHNLTNLKIFIIWSGKTFAPRIYLHFAYTVSKQYNNMLVIYSQYIHRVGNETGKCY